MVMSRPQKTMVIIRRISAYAGLWMDTISQVPENIKDQKLTFFQDSYGAQVGMVELLSDLSDSKRLSLLSSHLSGINELALVK